MGRVVYWTEEEKEYLREITPARHYNEIQELINKKFTRRVLTVDQIKNAVGRYKLKTGFSGKFPKGHIPTNKGQKGVYSEGSKKTWFKKGHVPSNTKPIGTEGYAKDGYIVIKIAEPNVWKPKHQIIYEKAHGKIPKGYCVVFADSNKYNFNLDNLILVSRAELLVMNRKGLFSEEPEITKTGANVAKLTVKINEINKKVKGGNKNED